MQHNDYTGLEVAEIIQSKLVSAKPDSIIISDILIDSRRLITAHSTLFFALVTNKNDGHNYIGSLHKQGIRYFVVSNLSDEILKLPETSFFVVDNTLTALQLLTASHRKQFKVPVIGITGSNGKTVIKEWLYQLMNEDKKIVRSPKSYNSQIGVPLSVWQMNEKHELAIFEAGISEPEEMQKLQSIINPDIGIFTNIGQAHNENFINTTQKTGEKLNLFKKVNTLIYNIDHKEVHGAVIRSGILENITTFCWGKDSTCNLEISEIVIKDQNSTIHGFCFNKKLDITIPFTDQASIENAIHCWATMLYLGYNNEIIKSRMLELASVAMRLELKAGINNCTIINDAYNSDFNSFAIALDFMNQQNHHHEKVVVLSDIMQSGQDSIDLYTNVANLVRNKNVHKFIGIGSSISKQADKFDMESYFFETTDDFIKNYSFANFVNQTILLKGARVFEFEKLSRILQQKAHETVLEVNLNNLIDNLNQFRLKLKPTTKIMAMVKAFSYGAGSLEIANVLQYHNVDYLAVAYADEGIELRQAGINVPIMVMSPEEQAFDTMIRHQLEPEIFSFRTLSLLETTIKRIALPQNKPVKIHIKIDTGMHRLGFMQSDVPELLNRLSDNPLIYIQSVFSHLVASDNSSFDDFTKKQIDILDGIKKLFKQKIDHQVLFHIANSEAINRFSESHMDMVRIGIGLYGITKNMTGLESVLILRSILGQIKLVRKGESVGYNRSWIAPDDTRIGIISIGYADGMLRSLGNGKASLYVKGKPVPVIGDICMDMCMVDLTGIDAEENEDVIIFNNEHSVTKLAEAGNTIPYEILSRISRRVKRIYFHE
ncbi:MAG TPA: bifunctional UDP-N-acetylmuramoyl-tripeptide:D-alanyl-D-alanine ligase/alanine racemase [Bacteroidales bacterium]|jgi:alanine racemase|nr:bifunctional UDP-N-acetylmuramoyl-tripeptide:D-alanyl-D-alanine ligase/alanine racemase [Bacteroidota bacterium]HJN06516.1 bifunctional UDP-N-acetylmuramoyl-tripeptide:D-alanyl-D-alanine ligase/alanine racemase [Bacteroidales bacterium]|tara:strand:- start:1220 stop:3703 length:2484 start_codon:yes stop_codon:yes gene_type:complete